MLLDSPTKQAAMRFQGAVITPATLSLYLSEVVGNPGLALEVVTDLDPVVSSTIYVPTSDDSTTGWVDQGAGAFTFADIDDRFNSAEYAKNTAALAATSSLSMSQRGSAAYAALANTRILGVRVGATVMLGALATNGAQCTVEARLNLGGAPYSGPRRSLARATQGQQSTLTATLAQPTFIPDLGVFYFDPSTGLPWTMATINLLIAATANYGWGLTLRGTIAAGGFAVSGTWIEVFTCAENRLGGFYTSVTAPRAGWTRYTLGSTAALAASTWYWLTVSCPLATQAAYARLPIVRAQRVNEPTTAAGTGEHRKLAMVQLGAPGAVPYTTNDTPTNTDGDTPAVTRTAGDMFPILLETAGPTVQAQSQAYAAVSLLVIDSTTAATLYGQQATAGANQSYGGVQLPILLEGPLVRPDRPMVVEVRSGGGAISGGGALNATATIDPANLQRVRRIFDLTGSPLQAVHGATIFVAFDDGPFLAANGVQYHIIVKSAATPGKGWRIPRLDSRSDNIGSGPSVANIEGATQGGQTDSYFASGTANDRYDLPILLVATPTAPVGNAVAVVTVTGEARDRDGVTETIAPSVLPPRVAVSWAATALTTSFAGYRVYRRRRTMPVSSWVLVADYVVGSGQTAATVEAQHTRFVDYEAAWGYTEGIGEEGWDYAFTVRNTNGMESFIGEVVDLDNDLVAPDDAWLTCNTAPWLNAPLRSLVTRRLGVDSGQVVYEVAGRDHAVVRTIDRVPVSRLALSWQRLGYLTDEVMRAVRAGSLSGRQMALLDCQGQLTYGVLEAPGFASGVPAARADMSASLTVTNVQPRPTDYNLPAELVLDATNDFATTPDAAVLNPASSAFTFFVAGRFSDAAGYQLSKGAMAAGNDGYGINRSAAGTLRARVDGATAAGTITIASGGWFDGTMQAAIATYDGATLTFWQVSEGGGITSASAALVAGAVTNTVALVAGADNGGASTFTGGSLRAWGVHVGVAYTAAQVRALGRYLCGMFGYAPPPGATVFFDLADDRCWNGIGTTLLDLAGTRNESTLSGSPATRGRPWPIRDLSRW